jgi:CheY-like chemotaxis protein
MTLGRVLIVDDNANNLNLLAHVLEGAGYEVRASNTGRRALQMAQREPPEIVLLDVEMPEMDGYEVCRELKVGDETRPIPVIFLSALDDVDDKVKGFEAGAVDYITKPFQPAEVLARVATQLELFRLRRELELRNRELAERNAELVEAHRRTDRVFSALAEALPGAVLDEKYRLDARIGSGGFGVVFRGTHLDLDRPVAVKVFRPVAGNDSPEGLERFRREGLATSRVAHPNAVEVYDFGISSTGIAYIVMELLRGFTVADALRADGVLPLARAAEIAVPLCEALAEAHAAGIVHRDVKPDNVFLHQTKQGEVVKVLDFGVAKLVEDRPRDALTKEGCFVGTIDYIAPERIVGDDYDGRSDVFSVGVMLYRMLSGRLPFESSTGGNSTPAVLKWLTATPTPVGELNPSLPDGACELVARALAREQSNRPTARELAGMLAEVGRG